MRGQAFTSFHVIHSKKAAQIPPSHFQRPHYIPNLLGALPQTSSEDPPRPPPLEREPRAGEHDPRHGLDHPPRSFPSLILGSRIVEPLDLLGSENEVAGLKVVLQAILLAGGTAGEGACASASCAALRREDTQGWDWRTYVTMTAPLLLAQANKTPASLALCAFAIFSKGLSRGPPFSWVRG